MKFHRVFFTYLIVIHLALIALLLHATRIYPLTSFLTLVYNDPLNNHFYRTTSVFYSRVDETIPPGSVLFIGDSHIQGLCVQTITTAAVNLGIGGDTTAGVLHRTSLYRSVREARALFLCVGVNDLFRGQGDQAALNIRTLLSGILHGKPVILSAAIPVDQDILGVKWNDKIQSFNMELRALCREAGSCEYVDVSTKITDQRGSLLRKYHIGDGIHLNTDGYRLWIEAIKPYF